MKDLTYDSRSKGCEEKLQVGGVEEERMSEMSESPAKACSSMMRAITVDYLSISDLNRAARLASRLVGLLVNAMHAEHRQHI